MVAYHLEEGTNNAADASREHNLMRPRYGLDRRWRLQSSQLAQHQKKELPLVSQF